MVETTFAADSMGFSTSCFAKLFDEKYGREWVKAHAMVGTKADVITTCVIDATAASGFKIGDVCADKAYLRRDNLAVVVAHGAPRTSRSR